MIHFSGFFTSAILAERDTHLLPDHIKFEEGTLIEPLACVIRAIKNAGDSGALIGTGTMGLMFIQSLLYWGVRKLTVYEILDWRIEKAKGFSAPIVLIPHKDPDKNAVDYRVYLDQTELIK